MTEFWVSTKKHYCETCHCWLSGNINNIRNHEQSERHITNQRRLIQNMRVKEVEKAKEKKRTESILAHIEQAAQNSIRGDSALFPSSAAKSIDFEASKRIKFEQQANIEANISKWKAQRDPLDLTHTTSCTETSSSGNLKSTSVASTSTSTEASSFPGPTPQKEAQMANSNPLPPTSSSLVSFYPSTTYQGSREGYVFKLGEGGVGYYVDKLSSSRPASFNPPASTPLASSSCSALGETTSTKSSAEEMKPPIHPPAGRRSRFDLSLEATKALYPSLYKVTTASSTHTAEGGDLTTASGSFSLCVSAPSSSSSSSPCPPLASSSTNAGTQPLQGETEEDEEEEEEDEEEEDDGGSLMKRHPRKPPLLEDGIIFSKGGKVEQEGGEISPPPQAATPGGDSNLKHTTGSTSSDPPPSSGEEAVVSSGGMMSEWVEVEPEKSMFGDCTSVPPCASRGAPKRRDDQCAEETDVDPFADSLYGSDFTLMEKPIFAKKSDALVSSLVTFAKRKTPGNAMRKKTRASNVNS